MGEQEWVQEEDWSNWNKMNCEVQMKFIYDDWAIILKEGKVSTYNTQKDPDRPTGGCKRAMEASRLIEDNQVPRIAFGSRISKGSPSEALSNDELMRIRVVYVANE